MYLWLSISYWRVKPALKAIIKFMQQEKKLALN